MNEQLFDGINGLAHRSAALDAVGRFAAADLLFVVAGVLAVLWVWSLRGDRGISVRVAAAGAVAVAGSAAAAVVLSHLWFEPRPFVGDVDTKLLIGHGADASFPSDHATVAAAAATVGALAWRRAAPILLGGALLVGLARVFVGVHYPGDIVAGWAIGGATGLAVWGMTSRVAVAFAGSSPG